MSDGAFQFEWDEAEAEANARKHGVTFELASTIFFDPNILTVADLDHSEMEDRWLSFGIAANGVLLSAAYFGLFVVGCGTRYDQDTADFRPSGNATRAERLSARLMKNQKSGDVEIPGGIDLRRAVRGLHYIPRGSKVMMPVSIERGVWEYFSAKAGQRGIDVSQLVTEVLKHDIEINEALR